MRTNWRTAACPPRKLLSPTLASGQNPFNLYTAQVTGMNGTSGYGDYAFLPRSGEVTYYNVLYVKALRDAADPRVDRTGLEIGHRRRHP